MSLYPSTEEYTQSYPQAMSLVSKSKLSNNYNKINSL